MMQCFPDGKRRRYLRHQVKPGIHQLFATIECECPVGHVEDEASSRGLPQREGSNSRNNRMPSRASDGSWHGKSDVLGWLRQRLEEDLQSSEL